MGGQISSLNAILTRFAGTRHNPLLRLAVFNFCSCTDFGFPGSPHLSLEIRQIELNDARAVAISYTWGEFDRQPRELGHVANDPSALVTFTLGREWRTRNFAKRLVELTREYGACWIDQVCMPQADEEIRRALVAIPDVFRTLPIVALFPGSLCKCLRQAWTNYQEAKERHAEMPTRATVERVSDALYKVELHSRGALCRNSSGLCSWTDRIWPLQELRFSTTIRVVWANDQLMGCEPAIDNPINGSALGDYSRLLVERLALKYDHGSDVMWMLVMKTMLFSSTLGQLMLRKNNSPTTDVAPEFQARFLLGETMKSEVDSETIDPSEKFIFFIYYLHILAQLETPAAASRPKDYIFSIWVDCTLYKIPENCNQLTAFELLDDALQQLRRKAGIFIPNYCPAGLFGSPQHTTRWYEGNHPPERKISGMRDLYGSFSFPNFTMIGGDSGVIPFRLDSAKPSRADAVTFEDFTMDMTCSAAIDSIVAIARNWDEDVIGKIHAGKFNAASSAHDQASAARPRGFSPAFEAIYSHLKNKVASVIYSYEEVIEVPDDMSNLAVKECLLLLLCDYLCIDPSVCVEKGVEIVVARRTVSGEEEQASSTATCIGLVNWSRVEDARHFGRDTFTLALHSAPERPFYEAVRIPARHSQPLLVVVGVWMPLKVAIQIAEIGGVLSTEKEEWNAVIV